MLKKIIMTVSLSMALLVSGCANVDKGDVTDYKASDDSKLKSVGGLMEENSDLTKPVKVAVSEVLINIKVGETSRVSAMVLPSAAYNRNVVWKSENEAVALVDSNGNITGAGTGECLVLACSEADESIYTSIKVVVSDGDVGETGVGVSVHVYEANCGTDNVHHMVEMPVQTRTQTTEATQQTTEQLTERTTEATTQETVQPRARTVETTTEKTTEATTQTTEATTEETTEATTQATTEATTEAQVTVPVTDTSLDEYFNYEYCERVLEIVNETRTELGLAPLVMDYTLQKAANVRAKEIEELFDHTRPDGTLCFTAIDAQGISYMTAGENIAYGQTSPEDVMKSWINSAGHYANIINTNFGHIGIACYYDSSSSISDWGGYYWVQMFTD